MSFIRNFWRDIRSGQNIDAYITILVAIVIAILGITGSASQQVILSAILAILALVATGLLANRKENRKLQDAVSRIENLEHLADNFLGREYDRNELKKLLRASREAFFWGTNFTRTIPLLRDEIEHSLMRGANLKFLLLKPNSTAVEMLAFRSRNSTFKELNLTLETNISALLSLKAENTPGTLEVRCINYLPYCTFVGFDPHTSGGHMFIRLMTFRFPNEARPTFELKSRGDKYWFDFFSEQFEAVWNEAEAVKPN